MTCYKPITAPDALNYEHLPSLPNWRDDLASRAFAARSIARQREQAAFYLKMRLAYRIPYHEWADAIARGLECRERLIEAYAPRFNYLNGESRSGPCCPPWASRRYREATQAAHRA